MELRDLIDKGAELKKQINDAKIELAEINKAIALSAPPNPGTKTSRALGKNYEAVIQFKEKETWDQEKIAKLEGYFIFFGECFKTEYKPDAKAIKKHGEENQEFAQAVSWARTVEKGTPYVKYELISDEIPF